MRLQLIRLRNEAEAATREGEVILTLAAARFPDNDILPPLVEAAKLIIGIAETRAGVMPIGKEDDELDLGRVAGAWCWAAKHMGITVTGAGLA